MTSRKITETDIDAEMLKRGWARAYGGGWVGGEIKMRVGQKIPGEQAGLDYVARRERVRQDLVRKAQGAGTDAGKAGEAFARHLMETQGLSKNAAASAAVSALAEQGQTISYSAIRNRLKKSGGHE